MPDEKPKPGGGFDELMGTIFAALPLAIVLVILSGRGRWISLMFESISILNFWYALVFSSLLFGCFVGALQTLMEPKGDKGSRSSRRRWLIGSLIVCLLSMAMLTARIWSSADELRSLYADFQRKYRYLDSFTKNFVSGMSSMIDQQLGPERRCQDVAASVRGPVALIEDDSVEWPYSKDNWLITRKLIAKEAREAQSIVWITPDAYSCQVVVFDMTSHAITASASSLAYSYYSAPGRPGRGPGWFSTLITRKSEQSARRRAAHAWLEKLRWKLPP